MGDTEWRLKLTDGFSGPANQAKGAADSLSSAFEKLAGAGFNAAERAKAGAAAAAAEGEALKKQISEVNAAVAAQKKLADAYDKTWGAARKAQSAAGSGMAGARLDNLMAMKNVGTGQGLGASVSKSVSGFAKLVQTVGKTFGQDAANGVMKLGQSFSSMADMAAQAGPALGMIASGAAAVAAAVVAATVALGAFAYAGITKILDAQKFKDDATDGFKAILGTDEAAQDVWDKVSQTSIETASDLKETMGQMNSLLAQGFSVDVADQIIRAMADIKAMDPKADVQGIADAFEKIHSQGALTEKTLKGIALASHLTTDQVKDALANDLGKKKAEIEQMLKSGKITADEAQKAIFEALQKKTGKGLGETAKDANNDVYGQLDRLKMLATKTMADMHIDWSGLTTAVDKIMAVLNGPVGQHFVHQVEGAVNSIVKALGDVDPKDIAFAFEALGKGIELTGEYLSGVIHQIEAFGSGIRIISEQATAAWNAVSDAIASIGPVGQAVITVIEDVMQRILWAVLNPVSAMMGLGVALSNALVGGIASGIRAATGEITAALTSALTSAVVSALDSVNSLNPGVRLGKMIGEGIKGGGSDSSGSSAGASSAGSGLFSGDGFLGFSGGGNSNTYSSASRTQTNNVVINASASDGPGIASSVTSALTSLNHAFA